MSRAKSPYISAYDKISEGIKLITAGLLNRLGDRADEGWDNVRFNNFGLCDRIVDLIVQSLRPLSITVTMNPLSLEQMIANGCYNVVEDEITREMFPATVDMHGQEVEIVLFNFNRPGALTSQEVLAAMRSEGCSPIVLEHLLAIGEQHRSLQRSNRIAALGSVGINRNGIKVVPSLGGSQSSRVLVFENYNTVWASDALFGGIRKTAPATA